MPQSRTEADVAEPPNVVAPEKSSIDTVAAGTYAVSLCVPPRHVSASPGSGTFTQPIVREFARVNIVAGEVTRETFDAEDVTPGWIDVRATVGGVLDANGEHRIGPLFPGAWELSLRPWTRDWTRTSETQFEVEPGSSVERTVDVMVAAAGAPQRE